MSTPTVQCRWEDEMAKESTSHSPSYRGVHPLWGNDAFPPCFRFPHYFWKKFRTPRIISPIWPFPKMFPDFHPPKFLTTFLKFILVIHHTFRISPLFSSFNSFPPTCISGNFSSPLLLQISLPDFGKFTCFYIAYFTCISFLLILPWCIYASHNARTGRLCPHMLRLRKWSH